MIRALGRTSKNGLFSSKRWNVTVHDKSMWEVVIGIEVHAQLKTKHKLLSHTDIDFSESKDTHEDPNKENTHYRFEISQQTHSNAPPNSLVGLCDGGLPGALPTINAEAVAQICKTGIALGGFVQPMSRFDRKHYSYPDLPNSYQITQQFYPLVQGGEVIISAEDYNFIGPDFDPTLAPPVSSEKVASNRKLKRIKEQLEKESKKAERLGIRLLDNIIQPEVPTEEKPRKIKINRIHLEHDSGKSIHDMDPDKTMIDLNRSGLALMEIVSEPEIHSSLEAALFVRKLQVILSHIQTAHTTMETGSMRCDLNISVRPAGSNQLGVRSEVKNLSSIKHLKAACDAEIRRHIEVLTKGGRIYQETRGFNFDTKTTYTQRRKETEVDYRFMPDPDLPVLLVSEKERQNYRKELPMHPDRLRVYYHKELNIPLDRVMTLINTPKASDYFAQVWEGQKGRDAVSVANWIAVELFGLCFRDQKQIEDISVQPEQLGSILDLIQNNVISGKIGKKVLREMYDGDSRNAKEIVQDKEWFVEDNQAHIAQMCKEVLKSMPKHVEDYQNGDNRTKNRLVKYFMGELMKASKGKLHPQSTTKILEDILKDDKDSH